MLKVRQISSDFIEMIKLDLFEKEDLKRIIEWNANKSADDLLQWAGPMYNYPLTLVQVENYFLNEVEKDNSNIFVYKIQLINTGEIIGTIELREVDENNKIGKICRFLIGEENIRGRGVGTEVLKEILRIGFEDLKFEKITLGVFDFNQSAIKCYENAGFTKVKFTENARKSSNGYWNLYEMIISKDEWQIKNK
ncbi:GNAT family N-acetyltransferase [Lutispora saccharofermentans]|uniref:GNAT family N-acetyltransferase n=1 Tax=Lutispora saccharofermentans TaxID=3024236 RepID=A0ABT1NF92_9FIRM|nr:GNAT family protein [Lutispora saccharofermentans]MCQ1529922.1 GNAT family N-acetyltransferase [Lutispora saccharofermentans]